jgi:glutamate/tyrosine decarboxylase-like PLP-dependent enzyme
LAWLKIAHQAGIGRSAVRLVATDGTGRMAPAALEQAIEQDLAGGRVPFMIAATAGTTNAGMIDPLNECADIARQHRLWYHVDAAWGGGLIASECRKHLLAGIERADSVTIDAHKWFATTMGCGIFITSAGDLLSRAFQVSASYMPSNTVSVDPYVTSAQWSRRFLGLRLFLSLAAVGWEGYRQHVDHTLTMSDCFKEKITALGWTVANDSPVGVVCITHPRSRAVRPIVNHVLATGKAWVSVAMFEGREVIRTCVTSGLTTFEDVDIFARVLTQAERFVRQQASF